MTKTYTISRADLKKGVYKAASVQKSGSIPVRREVALLARVLKEAVQK